MKVLLDTNIIIHRETNNVVIKDIGIFFNWLDKLKHEKCIHPITLAEIKRHKDDKVVKTMEIKLDSYYVLKTEAPVSEEIQNIIDKYDINENDRNDTKILNEVYAGRVDMLITEDKKIHLKAYDLKISHKVFKINSFLEKVTAENPGLTDYKVLSVKQEYFGKIDINDTFFDSFKADYEGFEDWFKKKSENIAYICKNENNEIMAFLYIKVEQNDENYADIQPKFEPKKRLKIGTFKVIMNGYKLGERFLKILFDNALKNNVDEIYVTIFNKSIEQKMLMDLLEDWGFEYFGTKKSSSGEERVLINTFSRLVIPLRPKASYPYISRNSNIWIVPIYPEYHSELFSDSILKTESPVNFVENKPHRNAISKVYISRSYIRSLTPGDVVVFYRTAEPGKNAYYSSVVSTIAVVEGIVDRIQSEKEFINLCRKRSVFTDAQLAEHWNFRPTSRPFIVNLLYVYSLPSRPNRKELIDLGIFTHDFAPRGFHRITKDHFNKILKHAKADESFIVD